LLKRGDAEWSNIIQQLFALAILSSMQDFSFYEWHFDVERVELRIIKTHSTDFKIIKFCVKSSHRK